MKRRTFVSYVGTLGTACLVMPELLSCENNKGKGIQLTRLGANFERGHILRDKTSNQPTKKYKLKTAIIGGGITGLSTAYHLSKQNYTDFLLFELNGSVGGNSNYGSNEHSKFPLGAHYLTLPNPENRPLITFLKEQGLLIKETPEGQQEYNERHLCFAPDERLLFRGNFHEGLVPSQGISELSHKEITRFFKWMDEFQDKKGRDGNYLFSIPLHFSSNDPILEEYDNLLFKDFLLENNFTDEYLLWFLDYCSRDDFGAGFDKISAWAGINYFAGRRANPSNTIPSNVLTWPEGNGHLVEILKKPIRDKIQTDTLIIKVEEKEDGVDIYAYDFAKKETILIESETCILCTPTYVNKHILKSKFWDTSFFNNYKHHPWLVTAVVLNKKPASIGLELAWDNVRFGTKGLGYIYDQHQNLSTHEEKHVISVYLAFDKEGAETERKALFSKTDIELKELVLAELVAMHPEIEKDIISMSFQLWGHGMVSSYPGSLKQYNTFNLKNSQSTRLHLAHTDYAGYSVFEEGFQMGINAAYFITEQQ